MTYYIYNIYIIVYLLVPNSWYNPPCFFPFGKHKFVFYLCETVSKYDHLYLFF